MSKMKKTIITIIFTAMITGIISIYGAYAATNYAISANKIYYSDNSNLGADNVQAALDGTCSKINNKLQQFTDSQTWKKAGETTGIKNSVVLTNIEYNELYIIVSTAVGGYYIYYIPKYILKDGGKLFYNGGYWSSTNNYGVVLFASLNSVSLDNSTYNSVQNSVLKIQVYYR